MGLTIFPYISTFSMNVGNIWGYFVDYYQFHIILLWI